MLLLRALSHGGPHLSDRDGFASGKPLKHAEATIQGRRLLAFERQQPIAANRYIEPVTLL
ncbi:MAG TPA: hypothetical protein VNN25_01575 [Thermoanaerobaculia bacterium]|nr:hypothetical protein [Thermoanaerobaculia bacterium]